MADFRFRAAAALELRRQQETAAATDLARAEAQLREAEARVANAEAQRRTAQDQQQTAERHGSDAGTLAWHRNWIARLAGTVEALAQEVIARTLVVRQGEQRWREARRNRLALERMRERAWRRYQQSQQREELKVIDELARLRFVLSEMGRDDP
jgi:flagellar protein FliJ